MKIFMIITYAADIVFITDTEYKLKELLQKVRMKVRRKDSAAQRQNIRLSAKGTAQHAIYKLEMPK